MKTLSICTAALTFAVVAAAHAQSGKPIPVSPDNFVRAETDLYFGNTVKDGEGDGIQIDRSVEETDDDYDGLEIGIGTAVSF